jgi:aspartyl-tRNA(Asn)/glutamyl-tRNA(Gln) amidotransferase subunit A
MTWDSVEKIAAAVNSGAVSASSNVEKSLELIANNSEYNAIISTIEARALERAANIDNVVASGGSAGRLAGVPFIAKDNFLVFGAETTAASNILKGFNAPYQSTVIDKLEAEGAICVAKANLDAFAHGGSTENSDYFTTQNPHDITRVSGGSSGGSAAAVFLELAPFALGSDTGGSIRQPASFTGVVGFKPSYGAVSRSGVVAMASSTDCIGPLVKTVEDAEYIFDIIKGVDPLDSTTIALGNNQKAIGKKIGIIKEFMGDSVQPEIREMVLEQAKDLRAKGYTVDEVSLPTLEASLAVYYVVVPAEISSNLSRYDGQRFGYSHPDSANLNDKYLYSRSVGFGREAKRRIMIGTHVLSSGYYDDYYKKAQTVRTKLINEFASIFVEYDYLIGPVAPTTAFKIGQMNDDPMQMYLADVMTVGVSLAGLPAISLPVAKDNSGLPIGLQVIACMRNDQSLLDFAKEIMS